MRVLSTLSVVGVEVRHPAVRLCCQDPQLELGKFQQLGYVTGCATMCNINNLN